MVRNLVENQIVHPRPVQFTLPGIRIGDNPPALCARPPEDDASDMKNEVDALKSGGAQRAMEEPVQFVGLHETGTIIVDAAAPHRLRQAETTNQLCATASRVSWRAAMAHFS